ncbi:HAD-IIIA family hydrolase [Salinispirillum sp. LH 10-3-1]|uniref:3-deoxy-D-manno-octulosonate 8-phosphate phosphatase KdsC n=1 Tax=Salinispirillum sp. LH 10-3-1 TaxID=2952525 RepID=A0AB38YBD8_9GAMM
MAISLLILDVDGVLTNGQLVYGAEGEVQKVFHVHDGLGIKVARNNGVDVAVISAKDSAPLRKRLTDLGIEHQYLGQSDKYTVFKDLLKSLRLQPDDVAYVGDDVIDIKVMREVGLPIAVQNAQPMVKSIAKHQTRLNGGEGAVREAIDYILRRQMVLEKAYEEFL